MKIVKILFILSILVGCAHSENKEDATLGENINATGKRVGDSLTQGVRTMKKEVNSALEEDPDQKDKKKKKTKQ